MEWEQVIKAAVARYRVILDGDAAGVSTAETDKDVFNIHTNLNSIAGTKGDVRFRSQDVEPLLDQATTILDKCGSDRSRWQSAGEKFANLRLDLFNSVRLDGISLEEERDGRFDVEAALTSGQRAANTAKRDATQNKLDALTQLLRFVDRSTPVGARAVRRAQAIQYIQRCTRPSLERTLSIRTTVRHLQTKWQTLIWDEPRTMPNTNLTKRAHPSALA